MKKKHATHFKNILKLVFSTINWIIYLFTFSFPAHIKVWMVAITAAKY